MYNSKDFGAVAEYWHDRQCSVLFAEQRGQNESGGSYMGFGLLERYDCLDWVCSLQQSAPNLPIYLCGVSMGAATVLMACDLNLPANIKGIIADCPYSSPKEIIMKVGKDMHFPPRLMIPFVWLGGFLFGHFNLFESSAAEEIGRAHV